MVYKYSYSTYKLHLKLPMNRGSSGGLLPKAHRACSAGILMQAILEFAAGFLKETTGGEFRVYRASIRLL